jgi:hypothetical protein
LKVKVSESKSLTDISIKNLHFDAALSIFVELLYFDNNDFSCITKIKAALPGGFHAKQVRRGNRRGGASQSLTRTRHTHTVTRAVTPCRTALPAEPLTAIPAKRLPNPPC